MKKNIIYIILVLVLLCGCNKKSDTKTSSSGLNPTTIRDYSPESISEFLKESEKLNKKQSGASQDSKNNEQDTKNPYNCSQEEYAVFIAINKIRIDNNLKELTWNEDLYEPMQIRAKELVKKFDHTRPNGSGCFTVSNKLRGENIAKDYPTPETVVSAWMNSKGHRENILSKTYNSIAIAFYKDKSGVYWVQGFGN